MTRAATILDLKDPGETDVITFDFTNKALTGESIASVTGSCEIFSGADPTPSAVYLGSGQIAGLTVLQKIQAGLAGNTYWCHCSATFTPTGRVLVLSGLLPVRKI